MSQNFFKDMQGKTETRFWINNPSSIELNKALEAGAVNCTTNPAYCSKLIVSEPDFMHSLIDDVIKEMKDESEAASEVYRLAVKRLADGLVDLHKTSNGQYGYVTIQDDPRKDENAAAVVDAMKKAREYGQNIMAKIPVISGSLDAIEMCLKENIPVCATEVFSIAQAAHVCEVVERVKKEVKKLPPVYVTHISGIFDEYLRKTAKRKNIDISDEVINQAGVSIAKKEYKMFLDRGYNVTLLGGGARGVHHFTQFVGGNVHITINWSTAEEILNTQDLSLRIDENVEQSVVDELCEKFTEFKIAYTDNGHEIEDFASYGPVQLFRNAFLKGWYQLLAEVSNRRHLYAI